MGLVRHGSDAQGVYRMDQDAEAVTQDTTASEARSAEALLEAWRLETDPARRDALIAAMASLRGPGVTDALAQIVEEGDAASRSLAILGWQGLPVEDIMHGARLLHSSRADSRVLALSVLQAAPGREAEGLLMELLSTEADPNVCAAAAELLAEWGPPAAAAALRDARARFEDDEFVVFSIDHALSQIRTGHE